MKYIFKNLIIYQFTLACSFLLGQSKAFKYNLFPGTPELKDVFITEKNENVFYDDKKVINTYSKVIKTNKIY